jgi:hypothetical protein
MLRYYEPDAPQVPDGSAEIPLHWGGMIAILAVFALLMAGAAWTIKRLAAPKR